MGKPVRYSAEVRERAVRLVLDQAKEYTSQWATIISVAEKIGCSPETLRNWVRTIERLHDPQQQALEAERERIKELERDLKRVPERHQRDAWILQEIGRVFFESRERYGVRKVWRQLGRESINVARCTVERLMRQVGLQGVSRGGHKRRTTIPDDALARPADLVNHDFTVSRPDALWVSDITYVSTLAGFAYVAFVIDAYSRKIVGWRVTSSLHANLVLDTLEQALHAHERSGTLVLHSDRGSQYLSLRYTERLAEAGIATSVGSKGDSYDNALAETVIGLYKAEVIHHEGPWMNATATEVATLEWVYWFNHRRLLELIGYVPPVEYELAYYQQQEGQVAA